MRCVTRTFRNDAHLTTFLTGRGLSGMDCQEWCTSRAFLTGRSLQGRTPPTDCHEWCASQTFLTGQSLQGQPPLECSVCSHELPMCVRGHMRMGVCGYTCACARA
jgi:hypothetical protein